MRQSIDSLTREAMAEEAQRRSSRRLSWCNIAMEITLGLIALASVLSGLATIAVYSSILADSLK